MLDRVAEWVAALDSTGTGPLSGRVVLAVAAVVVVTYAIVVVRSDHFGKPSPLPRIALAVVLALAAVWVFNDFRQRDLAAEQRALDVHAFELATRALAPGSALACLNAIAGETVEDACEKALFASPEATAAAASYVAAQLSLLSSAAERTPRSSMSPGIAGVLRAVETDRFGIVAHVLATRDRCTPDQCAAFFLLQDASRIRVNLAEQTFEAQVKRHMANWPTGEGRPVAANPASAPPPAAPVASTRTPNNLYFPSSASIPPVNIMTAEPPAPRQNDTTGTAEKTPTPPRRPSQGASPAAPAPAPPAPAANTPARSTPMQISPSP